MVHVGPKSHEWGYIGTDTETGAEYSVCARCGKFRCNPKEGPIHYISNAAYRHRLFLGKVKIR